MKILLVLPLLAAACGEPDDSTWRVISGCRTLYEASSGTLVTAVDAELHLGPASSTRGLWLCRVRAVVSGSSGALERSHDGVGLWGRVVWSP